MSAKFDFKTLETGFEADWPVKVSLPVDGGGVEVQTFMARFRSPTPADTKAADAIEDIAQRLKFTLQSCLVGLAKSEDQTLTPDLFEAMWASTPVMKALVAAFGEFRTGSPAKN